MKTSYNMLPSLDRDRPLIFMTVQANTCRVLKCKLPPVIRLRLPAAAVTLSFLNDAAPNCSKLEILVNRGKGVEHRQLDS